MERRVEGKSRAQGRGLGGSNSIRQQVIGADCSKDCWRMLETAGGSAVGEGSAGNRSHRGDATDEWTWVGSPLDRVRAEHSVRSRRRHRCSFLKGRQWHV